MARSSRTYRAEYAARKRRGEEAGVPLSVARGHGPIPVRIARGVERQAQGHPRALSRETLARYRRGIAEYERKYHGGLVTGQTIRQRRRGIWEPKQFASKEEAEEWLEDNGIPSAYAEFHQAPSGAWRIRRLH